MKFMISHAFPLCCRFINGFYFFKEFFAFSKQDTGHRPAPAGGFTQFYIRDLRIAFMRDLRTRKRISLLQLVYTPVRVIYNQY